LGDEDDVAGWGQTAANDWSAAQNLDWIRTESRHGTANPSLLYAYGRLRGVRGSDYGDLHPVTEGGKDTYQQVCRYVLEVIVQNRGNSGS
jgi:hypothetical protein